MRSSLPRYLLAVLAVGLALLVRVALAPYGKLPPYNTFYPFVILAAVLGGIWAGLLTTVLCALAAIYWLLPPTGEFAISSNGGAISLVIFCSTGVCISVVAELYRRSYEGLTAANAKLREEMAERKRVEESLSLSEEKFAKAFANNAAAVGMTRLKDGVFLEVNDTWVEMVGYSREEMIGHSSRRMIWPTRDACARCLRKLREKGSLRGWEQEFLKKSGEVFVAELSAQIWILNGKRLVVTTLVDITERKRAEKALLDSEGRFRAFFETAAVGTSEVDLQGRFVRVNQRFCQITGYSREELLGMTVANVTHPEERDHDWEQKMVFLQGRLPIYDVEKRYLRKDGSVIWVHVTSAMVRDGEGNLLHSAGIIQDITDHKKAEEALLCTEKLAATGRLAATIAHEVNNPLEGAMNAVFIAFSNPATPPQAREMLAIADQELRRAAHITQQTLGFYRASGSPTRITVPKLIDEVLSVYATKLQNRNITVHRRYRCGHCAEGCEACFLVCCPGNT